MSEPNAAAEPTPLRRFAVRWMSIDNASLALGLGLITAGAAGWSTRAALVTCGSLVLGVTLLRILLDGRAR
jgi:hypothetical protein